MFIDQARIFVKAGAGGNGCTSFVCSKIVKRGKADGGYGGDGGNVILQASKNMNTLLDFHYNKHFKAERGLHGSSNNKTGKAGKDLFIPVPCGTIIKDIETGLFLRDLVEDGQTLIIAKGGKGGKGNSKGRDALPGGTPEEREISLELKLIADIGIIGYPNAGKSTFISSVSRAKSKAASYPFTTKVPILGIVKHFDSILTFADMPGLIDGAHSGKGLGDRFLKHIERTKMLLHMVDISMVERKDPYQDLLNIDRELELYGHEISSKPKIIVFNKVDTLQDRSIIKKIEKKLGQKVFVISSVTKEGIKELLDAIFEMAV
ncbi:MAG: Obg family GTPase CgtA [Candidatus Omnitrophica bacterium]|nr:Obg family GTPase CgtA [Candidatus Omnitrophota bacterium]